MRTAPYSLSFWKGFTFYILVLVFVACSQNEDSIDPVLTQEEIDSRSDSITELSEEAPNVVIDEPLDESISTVTTCLLYTSPSPRD